MKQNTKNKVKKHETKIKIERPNQPKSQMKKKNTLHSRRPLPIKDPDVAKTLTPVEKFKVENRNRKLYPSRSESKQFHAIFHRLGQNQNVIEETIDDLISSWNLKIDMIAEGNLEDMQTV